MTDTTPPPKPTIGNSPFQKWMMDAVGIIILLLTRIVKSLAVKPDVAKRTRLCYRGREIIMFDAITQGLNISNRTAQRYRQSGKMKFYVSKDGRTVFTTTELFDEYIDENFVRSDSPEFYAIQNKQCAAGDNQNDD